MPTLDERVAYLEGRLEEHATTVAAVRTDLMTSVAATRSDVAALRTDNQELRRQIENLDARINSRIDALDSKVASHFTWLVGIQVATLMAMVGALLRASNH